MGGGLLVKPVYDNVECVFLALRAFGARCLGLVLNINNNQRLALNVDVNLGLPQREHKGNMSQKQRVDTNIAHSVVQRQLHCI